MIVTVPRGGGVQLIPLQIVPLGMRAYSQLAHPHTAALSRHLHALSLSLCVVWLSFL